MINYSENEKMLIKNLFQAMCVLGEISIEEIIDGLAYPRYEQLAEEKLVLAMKQLPTLPTKDYIDSAKIICGENGDPLSICVLANTLIFADLCEILTDKDIDSCLHHCIEYYDVIRQYEQDQAAERSDWQNMIHLDNAERVRDSNSSNFRKGWRS